MPALKPIKENNILKRNQIDIVDMSSMVYKHDGNTYRYILSIMDLFSRYIWLRPLKTKEAREVAHTTAKCIFMEWGTPCRVQTDQGNEFKGEFKRLCEELNIQLITSSPHHPQSQGKDEHSHQTWKSKIKYDYLKVKTNWVESLPEYQNLYNQAFHTSLGMSPHERHLGLNCPRTAIPAQDNDRIDIRDAARDHNNNVSDKMVKYYAAKHPPTRYNIGDHLLLKVAKKDRKLMRGGTGMKQVLAWDCTVIACDLSRHRYKVEIQQPDTCTGKVEKWVSVTNLTSKTQYEERIRRGKENVVIKIGMLQKALSSLQRSSKYGDSHIDNNSELAKLAAIFGLKVAEDNPGEGNCTVCFKLCLSSCVALEYLKARGKLGR